MGSGATRILLVSADCHAGAPVAAYRDYLPASLRTDYDDYLRARAEIAAERKRQRDQLFTEEATETFDAHQEVQAGGRTGAWDSERRLKELEREGVAAEVIFPDLQNDNEPPFGAFTGGPGSTPEQRAAGAFAYNRWLSDMCATHAGRHIGLALLVPHDVEAAVAEVRFACEAGFRGVILPTAEPGLPYYNDPRYDPLWAVCAELDMPLHTHSGAHRNYGNGPDATLLWGTESMWFNRRPFWHLLWSGAFERHPKLRLVITEQGADWIPQLLRRLDDQYESPLHSYAKRIVSMRPSEYWGRQCLVGATFLSAPEAAMRHRIGTGNMMWGSDYPHLEGTWPASWQVMRDAFRGVPEAEVRAIVGETAVDVYRLDRRALRDVADRIGPSPEDIVTDADSAAEPERTREPEADVFIDELIKRIYPNTGRG